MLPQDIISAEKGLGDWAILTAYRGSIAHGMYLANSNPASIDDKDIMAVCVPPIEYYFGLAQYGSRGTKEVKKNEWDIVIYEARKFIKLLAVGNPNVLSLLWLEPEHHIYKDKAGQFLLDNKEVFVGKHVYKSFVGYAESQLHKMTHMACKGYMGEKRKRLVEKFGYDTKNAAHLIRLLRMAIEFLKDGRMHVCRTDAEELLEIKRGGWKLEHVKSEAERLFKLAEEAYLRSGLPSKPDDDAVNDLCVKIIEMKNGLAA
jgi:predicted nucleotidyltransferase